MTKALSLWQPWASMIALDAKHYETRSWATSYRGPVIIHAAKHWSRDQLVLCVSEPFNRVMEFKLSIGEIPLQAGLCLVDLVAIHRAEDIRAGLSTLERSLGDYTTGRYAWELRNLRVFDQPVPARGYQGLFEWKGE